MFLFLRKRKNKQLLDQLFQDFQDNMDELEEVISQVQDTQEQGQNSIYQINLLSYILNEMRDQTISMQSCQRFLAEGE